MASIKKKHKLKNSYCVGSWLKNKTIKLKRVGFFTPSQRQVNNNGVQANLVEASDCTLVYLL